MLKEVVRATIHSQQVSCDDQPLEAYEVLEFHGLKTFTLEGSQARVLLEAAHSGNGVNAIGWDVPSPSFRPEGFSVDTRWEFGFGNNPRRPSSVAFGIPPALTAEYLGHPERDFWLPLISQQDLQPHPEAVGLVPGGNEKWRRHYVAISPVIRTNFYGINIPTEDRTHSQNGFTGRGMYILEFGHWSEESDHCEFKLGMALIADVDQKVRIYGSDWQAPRLSLGNETTQAIMHRLATANLFFNNLKEGKSYSWLKTGFPLHIVDAVRSFVTGPYYHRDQQDFKMNWGATIKDRYGINLIELLQAIPPAEQRIEYQRLQEAARLVLYNNH